jgi:hypothetical protein
MTTTVQKIAMVFGVVFLLVAIVGFISPGGMAMTVDPPGMLLGMFPVNMLHNVVHLLFGIWGLAASRSWSGAKSYAQIGGVIYLVLAVCGYFMPNGFGLVPLGGSDIGLHAVLGLVLAAVGFTAKAETVTTTTV